MESLTPFRLFNIPATLPIMPTFVKAVKEGGVLAYPDLRRLSIYVPTLRASEALKAQWRVMGHSYHLPNILPLGQFKSTIALPEALSSPARQMRLMEMILAWSQAGEGNRLQLSSSQAFSLAQDLASLIDEMTIEGVAWSKLQDLVPGDYDHYWNLTLDCLKIAAQEWPMYLAQSGKMDAADRRAKLLMQEAARLRQEQPQDPVIVLGSTGTRRATADFLSSVASLPQGAVVLCGLDQEMSQTHWEHIGGEGGYANATHPQAALYRLLKHMGCERQDVRTIGEPSPSLRKRHAFLSFAFLPVEGTDCWHKMDPKIAQHALEHVSFLEAQEEREEALAIALYLATLYQQDPSLTLKVITPDRVLARRVRDELRRWPHLNIRDSAGEELAQLPLGRLVRLIFALVKDRYPRPCDWMALLTHPLLYREEEERLLVCLEAGLLRLAPLSFLEDIEGVIAQVQRTSQERQAHMAQQKILPQEWEALRAYLQHIKNLFAPLFLLTQRRKGHPLAIWMEAHGEVLRGLLHAMAPRGMEEMTKIWDETMASASSRLLFTATDYQNFLERILKEQSVLAEYDHYDIEILGLLESRLISADRIVLAGLEETLWPPLAITDAFLNRPQRSILGLSSPERRMGQTAQDFVQAFAPSAEILLTRSLKRQGTPTVPSRFLSRMAALAGEDVWQACKARGEIWRRQAREMDQPSSPPHPCQRPMPCPSVRIRPTQLSVTRIETLRRDPYALYAEHILKVRPLDPLPSPYDGRVIGTKLHALMAQFVEFYPDPSSSLPTESWKILQKTAEIFFVDALKDSTWKSFHWPLVLQSLRAFYEWEQTHRPNVRQIFVEQPLRVSFPLLDGTSFDLTAVADRVEQTKAGEWVVMDFKTGRVPSLREVEVGFSPQLSLEVALFAQGGWQRMPKGVKMHDAFYLKLWGEERLEAISITPKQTSLIDLAQQHMMALTDMLHQFRDPRTPYLSRPFPQFLSHVSPYDHLARVQEWSL